MPNKGGQQGGGATCEKVPSQHHSLDRFPATARGTWIDPDHHRHDNNHHLEHEDCPIQHTGKKTCDF